MDEVDGCREEAEGAGTPDEREEARSEDRPEILLAMARRLKEVVRILLRQTKGRMKLESPAAERGERGWDYARDGQARERRRRRRWRRSRYRRGERERSRHVGLRRCGWDRWSPRWNRGRRRRGRRQE